MGQVLRRSASAGEIRDLKVTLQPSSGGDVFKEVNQTLTSIQKSRSRSDLLVSQKLERSASRSKFLDEVKQKRKDVEGEIEKQKILEEEERKVVEEAKKKEKSRQIQKEREEAEFKKRKEQESRIQSEARTSKLEEIFAPMRETSIYIPDYDPNHKEIKGLSENVQLKKATVDKKQQPKNQEEESLKRKPKFSLPAKPATFQKPKPKVEEPIPEPIIEPDPEPEVKEPTPRPPTPVQVEPPQPKTPTPTPEPELETIPIENEVLPDERSLSPRLSPSKILPPKVGINSFNTMGRLVLLAAMESGLDVVAVNDPFVPVNYMVYMLKFDIANSNSTKRKREMNVRESPTGQIIINGKAIQVFDEQTIEKIPWELAGVNYVVEAGEALNSLADARLHMKGLQKGYRMRHILEMEERNKAEAGESTKNDTPGTADPYALLNAGCRRVIIASASPDAPLLSIGVNDSAIDPGQTITSHASAPTSAITPVLHVLHKEFGIKSCAYTLLKSIRGRSKDFKCQNLGPTSYTRSVKWDFEDNLIPVANPAFEEETYRILPSLRGKLHGMCVYVPTPEVSMFDLTIQFNVESENMYRDVCLKLKEAANNPPLQSVMRYCMKMSDENSASSVFIKESHSSIVDGKSGCQVSNDTVKLVIWFDNEFGFANRIVDLITQAHLAYCQS